jgi:xylulokinase
VSFALKDSLDLIERLGVTPELLFAVGGGARSPVWRQILAGRARGEAAAPGG